MPGEKNRSLKNPDTGDLPAATRLRRDKPVGEPHATTGVTAD